MATASDLAVLLGLSTYKARAEASLGHAYSFYGGRPRKSARSEAVAIFYEIVYDAVSVLRMVWRCVRPTRSNLIWQVIYHSRALTNAPNWLSLTNRGYAHAKCHAFFWPARAHMQSKKKNRWKFAEKRKTIKPLIIKLKQRSDNLSLRCAWNTV